MNETMTDQDWVTVADAADLAENSVIAVMVGDRELAIYRLEGEEFRATSNICTHQYSRLCEGWFEDGVIECPLHAGQFDVRTGEGLCPPIVANLKTFEVAVRDGKVLVKTSG